VLRQPDNSLPIDNRNPGFNGLSDFNITNAAPLLQRDDQEFVLFQHYTLLEALYESPFYWMVADRGYEPTALAHRGGFTEAFARECLERVFGCGQVHANVDIVRKKGEKVGEIDVLLVFGNRAIVLQAKSKRLTLEARKGNDSQIQDDFKKAVQDAYDQAHDCAVALRASGCSLLGPDGQVIDIPTDVKEIYPICIVADHYPALSFQTRQFLKCQASERIAPPVVTDVFALDVITEMLESPLRLLSYLSLRARFNEKLMVTNELTLLSYHLKYNLWLGDEYDFVSLLDDFAMDLDVAMAVRREGLPGAGTPDGILTRHRATAVGRMLTEMDRRPDPAAIDLGLLLMQLSEDTIADLSRTIDHAAAQCRTKRTGHQITIGIEGASVGLTIHCNSRPDDLAAARLAAHSEARKYSQKAERWFGLPARRRFDSVRPQIGISLGA
jgi:hypothetical protein